MKELDKILKSIRENRPAIENREDVKNRIMEDIRRKDKGNPSLDLFRWTEIIWLRRALSVAAILLIVFFVMQQSLIISRISDIEHRMIGFSTKNILEARNEDALLNAVILSEPARLNVTDSINVAKDDLIGLIKAYRKLQEDYEMLQREGRNRAGSTSGAVPDNEFKQNL